MAAPIPKDQREYMSPYLSDLADIKIVVECKQCEIRKQFDGMALLERLDQDCNLVTLKDAIARKMGCQLALEWTVTQSFKPRCQMQYDHEAMERLNVGIPDHRIGGGQSGITIVPSDRLTGQRR